MGLVVALLAVPLGLLGAEDGSALVGPAVELPRPAINLMLDAPRWASSAVWSGDHAYVFGGEAIGWGPGNPRIVQYTPGGAVNNLDIMDAEFPVGPWAAASVWTGSHAYIFGGSIISRSQTDLIFRFDPATDELVALDTRLPEVRAAMSAVWTGSHVYLFGGHREEGRGFVSSDQVLRFDPATEKLEVLPARLPTPRESTSAVWIDGHAYIFGGAQGPAHYNDILRFDPASGTITGVGRLPTARYATAAFSDGTRAYIIGGYDGGNLNLGQIVRFDPQSEEVRLQGAVLLPGRSGASVAWDGQRAHIFGGSIVAGFAAEQIVTYDPATDTINGLAATPQPPPLLAESPIAACPEPAREVRLDGRYSTGPGGVTFVWHAPCVAFDNPSSPHPVGAFPAGTTPVLLRLTTGQQATVLVHFEVTLEGAATTLRYLGTTEPVG